MNRYLVAATAAVTLLTGCNDELEGVFEPSCIAYEGDRISFSEGNFEWHRFTDEVRLDDDGNKIDPFPDYPKTGTYTIDKEHMALRAVGANETVNRYLVEHRGELYLLNWKESEAVLDGEPMPTCALRLVTAE